MTQHNKRRAEDSEHLTEFEQVRKRNIERNNRYLDQVLGPLKRQRDNEDTTNEPAAKRPRPEKAVPQQPERSSDRLKQHRRKSLAAMSSGGGSTTTSPTPEDTSEAFEKGIKAYIKEHICDDPEVALTLDDSVPYLLEELEKDGITPTWLMRRCMPDKEPCFKADIEDLLHKRISAYYSDMDVNAAAMADMKEALRTATIQLIGSGAGASRAAGSASAVAGQATSSSSQFSTDPKVLKQEATEFSKHLEKVAKFNLWKGETWEDKQGEVNPWLESSDTKSKFPNLTSMTVIDFNTVTRPGWKFDPDNITSHRTNAAEFRRIKAQKMVITYLHNKSNKKATNKAAADAAAAAGVEAAAAESEDKLSDAVKVAEAAAAAACRAVDAEQDKLEEAKRQLRAVSDEAKNAQPRQQGQQALQLLAMKLRERKLKVRSCEKALEAAMADKEMAENNVAAARARAADASLRAEQAAQAALTVAQAQLAVQQEKAAAAQEAATKAEEAAAAAPDDAKAQAAARQALLAAKKAAAAAEVAAAEVDEKAFQLQVLQADDQQEPADAAAALAAALAETDAMLAETSDSEGEEMDSEDDQAAAAAEAAGAAAAAAAADNGTDIGGCDQDDKSVPDDIKYVLQSAAVPVSHDSFVDWVKTWPEVIQNATKPNASIKKTSLLVMSCLVSADGAKAPFDAGVVKLNNPQPLGKLSKDGTNHISAEIIVMQDLEKAGSTLSWANPQDKLDPSELVKGKQVEVPAYSLRAVGVNGDMPTALMQQWGAKALTNGRGPKGKKP